MTDDNDDADTRWIAANREHSRALDDEIAISLGLCGRCWKAREDDDETLCKDCAEQVELE